MSLPTAQSRLATLADQSVRVDSPLQYGMLGGKGGAYAAANAYWDGAAWYRYDAAQPATVLVIDPGNQWRLLTAPAGTGTIAWTVTTLGADSGWQAVAFAANWADWGGGETPGGYRKNALGQVELKGQAKKAVALVANDTILTLPAGYRPATQQRFAATSAAGFTELTVTTAGAVLITQGGSAVFTGMSTVRYDPST